MRELVAQYLDNRLSRRGFFQRMIAAGFASTAIEGILNNLEASEASAAAALDTSRAMTGTGGDLWVEQLRASGVEYVFCNPGSVEVGFYDAFSDTPGMQLIVGLHEGIVISMADGYHQLTGKTSFVNVHAMPGTAQSAGQLHNAHRSHSAIVMTAGLSDNTVFSDASMLGPAAGTAQSDATKPFTKIGWDVRQPGTIPVALRRAFKLASTPPGGPVYLGVASYAQSGEQVTAQIVDQKMFDVPMRPRPDAQMIEEVARRLIEGRQPLLMVDYDLSRYGAVEAAVKLVDLAGVPVLDSGGSRWAHSGFPNQHPLYWDGKIFGGYDSYDVIVGIGAENIASTRGGGRVPEQITRAPNAWKAAIGLDVDTMGNTAPFELGVVADLKVALEDLMEAIQSLATEERLVKIKKERMDREAPQIASERKKVEQEAKEAYGQQPMHPYELAMTMEKAIDRDAILVNENLSHDFTLRHGVLQNLGGDAKTRLTAGGGSLGWGIGAAIGAKIGQPDRQVVLNIGDGSTMYSAAGFWTLARYGVPALIVVWNNHNYQTVRHGFAQLNKKMAKSGHYVGMHLGDPNIDFAGLAKSQGVEGEKATTASEFAAALERGVAATRAGSPYLIDAAICQIGGGAGSDWHQTFNLAEKRKRKV